MNKLKLDILLKIEYYENNDISIILIKDAES